jgi:tetraacyldisaccharide 4'-kinase
MKLNKPGFWDYKKPNFIAYILLPLTFFVLVGNFFTKKFSKKKNDKIKTICVGNIYIGGTGKTPLSIKINNLLKIQGLRSTIIKKFYNDQSDEQNLIKNYTNLICKKNRSDALNDAVNQNFEFAIFDDGIQEKSISYNLKIVCFTNSQWKGNGFIIPAGPLREKIESLKNFDVAVINGDPKKNQDILNEIKQINNNINIFETFYKPSNLKEFDNNVDYVAFAGIGNSENFYNTMIENKLKVIKKFSFPDHYTYSNNDLTKILNYAKNNNAKVITTEKDYLRLNPNLAQEIKYLKLDLIIPDQKKLINILIKK